MTANRTALVLTALLALVAACGAPSEERTASGGASAASQPTTSRGTAFATGSAVLVSEGYQAPKDRVDTTGAFLPTNGKPTIVWVDAIW